MGPPRERDGEENTRRGLRGLEELQWGRRANATESVYMKGVAGGPTTASMGPPRERDGEIGEGRGKAAVSAGFNGAAARTRRRANAIDKAMTNAIDASMGPPRERDGEADDDGDRVSAALASMGPPRERDGELRCRC